MTRSAVQHKSMKAPGGNQKVVILAVVGALTFAALPFISKEVGLLLCQVSPTLTFDVQAELPNPLPTVYRCEDENKTWPICVMLHTMPRTLPEILV
jgi:hypothetical protein